MYELKTKPEDFLVEEVTIVEPREKGKYSLWWMTKKDYNTLDATRKIAKVLRVKDRFVGFAGTKDRKAITKQLISVFAISKERMERLSFPDIKFEFFGYSDRPVSLGDLEGNNFKIVIRNLDKIPEIKNKKIKNFFGEQRFSTQNAEIGRAIVKKDFKSAANMIAESQESVLAHLKSNQSDFVGAIRTLPQKILKIYVHSYQSLLWNRIAENMDKNIELPLIGFDIEIEDEKIEKIVENIMKEEGITYRDFIIKEIPELSAEGAVRNIFVEVKNLEILEKGEDDLNPGKYKIKLKFFLPKGSYATEAIKQLI